ncbi:hypothetical protein S101441_03518 [Bacillus subtilis subsp. subtilis]|nr:hypothetical protein S101441_03518 [Bacillus subtilis subsp. subtilis]
MRFVYFFLLINYNKEYRIEHRFVQGVNTLGINIEKFVEELTKLLEKKSIHLENQDRSLKSDKLLVHES